MLNAPSESAASASRANAIWLRRLAVTLLTPFSLGNFGSSVISARLAIIQQFITIVIWLVVIAVSYLVPPRSRLAAATDTYCAIAFYGIAVGSVFWSNYSADSFAKAAAFLISTFGE